MGAREFIALGSMLRGIAAGRTRCTDDVLVFGPRAWVEDFCGVGAEGVAPADGAEWGARLVGAEHCGRLLRLRGLDGVAQRMAQVQASAPPGATVAVEWHGRDEGPDVHLLVERPAEVEPAETSLALADAPPSATVRALELVLRERDRQRERWGDDPHPDVGDGWWSQNLLGRSAVALARTEDLRALVEAGKARDGGAGWLEILCEEVGEARDAAEMMGDHAPRYALASNRRKRREDLRAELVQVAAVAVAWLEDLERRDAADEDAHG